MSSCNKYLEYFFRMIALSTFDCSKQKNGNEILGTKYQIIQEYFIFMQFISYLHVRVSHIHHEDDSNFSDQHISILTTILSSRIVLS